jgi:carbon storage regulator CsrA
MLILSRRPNEKILFPGLNTTVQVVSIKAGAVRLGIDAPPEVSVLRAELAGNATGGAAAVAPAPQAVPRSGVEELEYLLEKRLRIAGKGLAVLREQFLAGLNLDLLLTLDEVEEELRSLSERVRGEVSNGAARPERKPASKHKALVVEDNPQERELLALCLRFEGLDVDTAGDGVDALDYLKARGRPDVVLLDMGLPRLDGPTTVQAIRRNPACAGLKIFVVSGHAADEYQLPIGPAGVDRWFQKPIDPATLVRDLHRELEGVLLTGHARATPGA